MRQGSQRRGSTCARWCGLRSLVAIGATVVMVIGVGGSRCAVGQSSATSAWATGGASASAKPTDTDGKPAAAAGAATPAAAIPFWQATAVPGHVIQMGTMPAGWQPQAVPYQGIGPDGQPLTMYIAPTYVFTYQSGPPVPAAPPVNRRQTRGAPWAVAPAATAPGWNYQTAGAPPLPAGLPPPTEARYRPQPYQLPADARGLTGTPIVPPQSQLPPPPPQNWGMAPPPQQAWQPPPPNQWSPQPDQWVPAPTPMPMGPGGPPPDQWMPSNVPPPPGVAPFAAGAAMAAPAMIGAATAAPPPPTAALAAPAANPPAPIPVAAPQPIAAQPVSSAPPQPMAAPAAGLPPNATPANTHTWKVVAVYDGDTVTCLDENNQQQKIRLAEIDAPEAKQDFGQASRQSLANMVFGRTIQVVDSGRDRYGRWIGRLYVDGIDVNRQQIATGMAWHYADYSKDKSLATVQAQAQAQRIGLWSQPNPIPPWDYRKSGGKK
jgi:endonuclease YncB( thermonuclease family)